MMRANVPKLLQQKGTEEFIKTLRASARVPRGPLVGIPEVHFQLPAAMVRGGNDAGDGEEPDVHVPYLFRGFEQRQTMEFQPVPVDTLPPKMDPDLKDVLASFGDRLYLQVTEVLAGNMDGRRMEVSLHQRGADLELRKKTSAPAVATALESSAREGSDAGAEKTSGLSQVEQELLEQRVKCALGVARLLTKLGSGELPAMLHNQKPGEGGPRGVKQSEKDEMSAVVSGQ